MARPYRKMRPAPIMLYRDGSGKFASRRGGRRRYRRNPADDPAAKEADAALKAIAEKEKRKEAARKAAETKARKKAEAAAKEAEAAAKTADSAKKAADKEQNAALKEIYQAEARKAAAEARKALADAKKAEAEAKKAKKEADQPAPSPKVRRKRATAEELYKRSRQLRSRAKSIKDRGLKSVYNQRASALSLQARSRKGKLSKNAKKALKAHGISRVNPGLKGVSDQLRVLAPRLAVTAVAAAGAYGAGAWYADKVKEAESPFMRKYGAAVGTGGFSAVAYLLSRYVAPRYSAAVLSGGLAATVVQVILARRETPVEEVVVIEQPAAAPIAGIPSVEDFANPTAEDVLANSGSLRGSIF